MADIENRLFLHANPPPAYETRYADNSVALCWSMVARGRPEISESECRDPKRARSEAYGAGAGAMRSSCAYKSCNRSPWEVKRGVFSQFCSITHRNLFMDRLARRPGEGGVTEADDHNHCELPGCGEWKSEGGGDEKFNFCSRKHALRHAEEVTRRWAAEGRLCRYERCNRHVHVDKGTRKCYDYCGFSHALEAAKERGARAFRLTSPDATGALGSVVNEGQSQETSEPCQQGNRGYYEKISDRDLEKAIRDTLTDPSNVDPRFKTFDKKERADSHPWDLVTENKPWYFLHFIDGTRQKQQRKTREGCKWKQSSKSHIQKEAALEVTYFSYELGKNTARPDALGESHASSTWNSRSRWRMHEITLRRGEDRTLANDPKVEPIIWKIYQEAKRLPQNEEHSPGSIPSSSSAIAGLSVPEDQREVENDNPDRDLPDDVKEIIGWPELDRLIDLEELPALVDDDS